jgi:hypothetical protein
MYIMDDVHNIRIKKAVKFTLFCQMMEQLQKIIIMKEILKNTVNCNF